jgi:hypothetical protein
MNDQITLSKNDNFSVLEDSGSIIVNMKSIIPITSCI